MQSPIIQRNKGKLSLISSSFMSDFCATEEEKIIEETLMTSYEKALNILLGVKDYLIESSAPTEKVDDLKWVIERIKSNKLYSFDSDKANFEEKSNPNPDIRHMFGFVNDFSERKLFQRRPRKEISKTVRHPVSVLTIIHEKEKQHKNNSNHKINLESGSILGMNSKEDNLITIESFSKEYEDKDTGNLSLFQNLMKDNESQIIQSTFNIFKFESQVGRENVFYNVATACFNCFDYTPALDKLKLNGLILEIKNNYNADVFYHNEMHGADVGQTMTMWMKKSDMVKNASLSEVDTLASVFSALVHDVGHPGLNNNYQTNSVSENAITYNDKSVLENYHISLAFKLILKPENNIISHYNKTDFKVFRKRCIETILATDMIQHAKIVTSMKNKVVDYRMERMNNSDHRFIRDDSKTLFDDQQDLLNFVLHTADLSHNSKEFSISFKWVEKLMDEFWHQGDLEKQQGLAVSFLCDRIGADVPTSQVGFIKGIIVPTFEVLSDILPQLSFLMDQIYTNLNEWSKLTEGGKKSESGTLDLSLCESPPKSPRKIKSPRKEKK